MDFVQLRHRGSGPVGLLVESQFVSFCANSTSPLRLELLVHSNGEMKSSFAVTSPSVRYNNAYLLYVL